MDGRRSLVEVRRNMGLELALFVEDLFEDFLDVEHFEVVETTEEVGDGLLAGLARPSDEDVGVSGQLRQFLQVFSRQVEEGV